MTPDPWRLMGKTAEERLQELAQGSAWQWSGSFPPNDNCAACGYLLGRTGAWRAVRYYAIHGVCLDCYYKWKDLNRLHEVARELMS